MRTVTITIMDDNSYTQVTRSDAMPTASDIRPEGDVGVVPDADESQLLSECLRVLVRKRRYRNRFAVGEFINTVVEDIARGFWNALS